MALIKLTLLHLAWLGSGWLVLEWVAGPRRTAALRLLEMYVTGMALHVAALYAWVALAPVSTAGVRALFAAGLAAGLVGLVTNRNRLLIRLEARDLLARAAGRPGWLDVVLVGQLVPPLLLVLAAGWCVALHHWDPLAIWATKAGLIFHGEFLGSEAFVNLDRVNPHHGYPVGYSLVLLEHAAVAGRPDQLMMNRGLVIVVVAGLIGLGLLVAEWAGRRMALAALGLLLWTPALWRPEVAGSASSGYADLPLGLFAALGAGLLLRGITYGDRASLAAGSACLALTASFKNEGMVWTVLICTLLLLALSRRRPQSTAAPWLALAVPLAAVVLLRLAHAHLPTSSDVATPSPAEASALLDVLPRLGATLVDQLVANPMWGALRVFLPAALVAGLVRARREPLALLGLAPPLFLAVAAAVLGLTEVQLGAMEGYSFTMFPRLVVQLLPSAVLLAVVLNSAAFPSPTSRIGPGFRGGRRPDSAGTSPADR